MEHLKCRWCEVWARGPQCWFLRTASGVSAGSVTGTLPPTVFWSGGEWKSQNCLKHLSWGCQSASLGWHNDIFWWGFCFFPSNTRFGFFLLLMTNKLIFLLDSSNSSRIGRHGFLLMNPTNLSWYITLNKWQEFICCFELSFHLKFNF